MIVVALVVVMATAVGIVCERRSTLAQTAARWTLGSMLYVLLPFVSFVNIAHLRVTLASGVGLAFAYLVIGTVGAVAWAVGRFWLRLPRPTLGGVICGAIIANTGYLGLPSTVALLGPGDLSTAVAYDQLVGGPVLFLGGFGVGAAFGSGPAQSGVWSRFRTFLTRNPPLLAVVAGLLAPASLAPASVLSASHVVVAALLPLGFFAVGVNLSAERRQDNTPLLERPDRRVVLAVGLRLFAAPLLLAGISASAVTLPSAYLLQAAMPTGINSLIVGHAYGLDQRLIATIIVWSTAVALVTGLVVAAL